MARGMHLRKWACWLNATAYGELAYAADFLEMSSALRRLWAILVHILGRTGPLKTTKGAE